ncbi:MAG: hypothetical protein EPN99_07345, partial [Frankiales bacterium]
SSTGAHATTGRIGERYVQLGAENGSLGFPIGDETVDRDSPFKRFGMPPGGRQEFEGGTLSYDARTGTVVMTPRSA